MKLAELKTSFLNMPIEAQFDHIRAIRLSRREVKESTRKRQAKSPSVKRETKAMKEIKQNPEELKALLQLLGVEFEDD